MPIKELLNGTRLVWFLNLYKSDIYQKQHSCRPIHGTQHAPWIFDCIFVPKKEWILKIAMVDWPDGMLKVTQKEGFVIDDCCFVFHFEYFELPSSFEGALCSSFYCYFPGIHCWGWRCIYIYLHDNQALDLFRKATTTPRPWVWAWLPRHQWLQRDLRVRYGSFLGEVGSTKNPENRAFV